VIIDLHDKRHEAADWLPKIQYLVGGTPLILEALENSETKLSVPSA
jgi:hypothetical protein